MMPETQSNPQNNDLNEQCTGRSHLGGCPPLRCLRDSKLDNTADRLSAAW